jgi:hypothetical protein
VPVTVSVTGRLLRTRHVAWAALLALAGLVFGAFTVREAARMRRVPVPGVILDGLTVVDTTHPSLAPGDEIVAVDRVRAYPQRLAALLEEIAAGPLVPVTFQRGAAEITVAVDTAPLSRLHQAALWVRVLCAIACFLVGVVSFVLMPGSRPAWLFLVFCANLELTLGFNVLFDRDPLAFLRLEPIAFALGGSLGLHLFTELPERLPLLRRRPWAVGIVYLPALAIVLLSLFHPPPPAGRLWIHLGLAGAAWSILGGVLSLTVLALGRRRADREADEPLASRYRTLLVAVVVGLFVPALVHTARGLAGLPHGRWVVHLNAAPVVVYAAATGYALLRQNVMGADRVTTAVVSYAATLMLLAAGCGLVLVAVHAVFGGAAGSPTVLVLVTAAASLSMVPVYRRLKRAIDRRFQRDRASDERITQELRDLMRLAMIGDPAKTMNAAFKALSVLSPERVVLWVREAGGEAFHLRREEPRPPHVEERQAVPVASALGRAMLAEQTGGVEGLAPSTLPPEAQGELWDRGLALASPVTVQGDVRAFVAVGRRASGARFAAGDQSFLAMVASQVGLALERGQAGTSIGRYRLDRRLGTGGMAEVYLARQIGLAGFERRVAIKRPLPHLGDDAGYIAMLLDEAKLAALLHHPNIVETYEIDRQGGTYYIAMEYVDGASLRALLRGGRALGEGPSLAVTARIADALLSALAHAHDAVDGRGKRLGIVHRDVTPGNVLVGKNGEVKLVDFGVARSAARLHVTQTGVVKGTLAYMSPEQAAGGGVDARSDLFGAGAVIYECLMAQPPYPDGPPKTAPAAPPPVSVDVPRAVVEVVQRALAFEPAARFASAAEMREAFLAACRPLEPASAAELASWQKEILGKAPEEDPAFGDADTQTVRA